MLIVDRLKFGRVEIFVQIGASLFGDSVKSAVDLVEKSVSRQLFAPRRGILSARSTEFVDGDRGKVPVFPDQLQNTIVTRNHPVGPISHYIRHLFKRTHSDSDRIALTTLILQSMYQRLPCFYNRQQLFVVAG